MSEAMIDRFLIRAVPRMVEWDQGHDWIVDGDNRLEIAWFRNGSDWTFWSAAETADKRAESAEDIVIHCSARGKQLNQALMADVAAQLQERCQQLA